VKADQTAKDKRKHATGLGETRRVFAAHDSRGTGGTGDAMTATRIRAIGRWTAIVAVYALAFNVILTSMLLASVSPLKSNAAHELCLNGSSGPSSTDDNAKPIIRCPLCLSGVAAMADQPPQTPALAIRIALQVLFEPARLDDGIARFTLLDHQPRGPPHLS
jgi:hypothetical protein